MDLAGIFVLKQICKTNLFKGRDWGGMWGVRI